MYSLRARYYDPGVGRFLTQDTYPYNFQNPLELNRYGYTANNPINGRDPSGNMAIFEQGVNLAKDILESRVGLASASGFLTGGLGASLTYLMGSTGQCGEEAREWTSRVNLMEFVLYSAGIGAASSAVYAVGGVGIGLAFTALGTYQVAHTNGEGFVRGVEFTICNLIALLTESVRAIVDASQDYWTNATAFGAAAVTAAGTSVAVGAGGATGTFLGLTEGIVGGLTGIVAGAVLATDLCPPDTKFNPQTKECEKDEIIRVRHYSRNINGIKRSNMIRDMENGQNIFVEYPITAARDEASLVDMYENFGLPQEQFTGIVEFNVDTQRWRVVPDPAFGANSRIPAMMIKTAVFPLGEPDVNAVYFDRSGQIIP